MPAMLRTYVYPVRDLPQATALYRRLMGVDPYVESPYYVGFRVDEQEIGLDPNGHAQGVTAPLGYYHVEDIRAALARRVEAGAAVQSEVRDVGGGRLIATVRDADGNVSGLLQSP